MDIDNLISDVIKEDKNAGNGDKIPESNIRSKIDSMSLNELLEMDILSEDIQIEIYNRFESDIELLLDNFMLTCKDINADKGMYKCYLETWQYFISEIGRNYFNKYKYLRDNKRIRAGGGQFFKTELLRIGLALYEDLCQKYRKQFFIYDACKFLGMSLDTMYELNNLHSEILKKAHSMQESSMRTALASGRSNVTAMAILLNHDYDYTRTTQVIHTTDTNKISADKLPELATPQDVVFEQKINDIPGLNDNSL